MHLKLLNGSSPSQISLHSDTNLNGDADYGRIGGRSWFLVTVTLLDSKEYGLQRRPAKRSDHQVQLDIILAKLTYALHAYMGVASIRRAHPIISTGKLYFKEQKIKGIYFFRIFLIISFIFVYYFAYSDTNEIATLRSTLPGFHGNCRLCFR